MDTWPGGILRGHVAWGRPSGHVARGRLCGHVTWGRLHGHVAWGRLRGHVALDAAMASASRLVKPSISSEGKQCQSPSAHVETTGSERAD